MSAAAPSRRAACVKNVMNSTSQKVGHTSVYQSKILTSSVYIYISIYRYTYV